jgi:hypothetical protein
MNELKEKQTRQRPAFIALLMAGLVTLGIVTIVARYSGLPGLTDSPSTQVNGRTIAGRTASD